MAKTRFICWKPDLGETEETDGLAWEEYTPETAAEHAVERGFWDDPSEEDVRVDVRVRYAYLKEVWDAIALYRSKSSRGPEPTGDEVRRFVVTVESEPVFRARRLDEEET